MDFEAIAAKTEEQQLKLLQKQDQSIKRGFIELMDEPGYMRFLRSPKGNHAAKRLANMPDETKEKRDHLLQKAEETTQLKYYLYAHSPHKSVQEATQSALDDLITRIFPHETEDEGGENSRNVHHQHNLLYLSVFGGNAPRRKTGLERELIYQFNFSTDTTAPLGNMKHLYKHGMLEINPTRTKKTQGSNLTFIGEAVLARLTEKFGEPPAAKNNTVQGPASLLHS